MNVRRAGRAGKLGDDIIKGCGRGYSAFCILKILKPVLITVPSSAGVAAVNNVQHLTLKFKSTTNSDFLKLFLVNDQLDAQFFSLYEVWQKNLSTT
jgi:hypothetical protein